jgi:hypothetical protein
MVNSKVNLSNGSGESGIKMGDILTREELKGGILRPGRGVVVKQRGANYFAAGNENSVITDEGKDTLRKNLIGAGYNHEEAFLVKNVGGIITWEKGDSSGFHKKEKGLKPDASLYPAFNSSQFGV